MAKAKITITGGAMRPPVFNADGTVDLYFKTEMTEAVPKGLKLLGSSFAVVHVGPRSWKAIEADVQLDSFFIIQGWAAGAKNSKGVPFLNVVASHVDLRVLNEEQKTQDTDNLPLNPGGPQETEVKKDREPVENSKWYEPDEIEYISVDSIYLTEKVHLNTGSVYFGGILKILHKSGELRMPMAVRPIGEGKYSLAMGIRAYMAAKIMNIETVPVVIRDMGHYEMMEKYGISENPKMAKKK